MALTKVRNRMVDFGGGIYVGGTGVTVGKTAANNGSTAGSEIQSDGQIFVTKDSDAALYFNRLTNDGSLAIFKKDGATVGSIGTLSGDMSIGTGNAGLRFNDPHGELLPHNVSTNSGTDGTVILGSGGVRFKDLYLSGGVYLGGTGAANKLDDYESGTWTPAMSVEGQGSMTLASPVGRYTKVGNIVTVTFSTGTISSVPNANSARAWEITGIPFALSGSAARTPMSIRFAGLNANAVNGLQGFFYAGASLGRIEVPNETNPINSSLWAAGADVYVSCTYESA
mgnify:CR=1 FL=1